MSIKVEVDLTVNAAYITLSDEKVDRTVRLGDGILVDLDSMGIVVGIEVLNVEAELPLQQLRDEFHVHSSVVDLLYKLRPSVAFQYARFQQHAEGVSARTGQALPV